MILLHRTADEGSGPALLESFAVAALCATSRRASWRFCREPVEKVGDDACRASFRAKPGEETHTRKKGRHEPNEPVTLRRECFFPLLGERPGEGVRQLTSARGRARHDSTEP